MYESIPDQLTRAFTERLPSVPRIGWRAFTARARPRNGDTGKWRLFHRALTEKVHWGILGDLVPPETRVHASPTRPYCPFSCCMSQNQGICIHCHGHSTDTLTKPRYASSPSADLFRIFTFGAGREISRENAGRLANCFVTFPRLEICLVDINT